MNYQVDIISSYEWKWFSCLFLYFIFEFVRLHDLIGIGFLRPLLIINICLAFFIIKYKKITIINENLFKIFIFVILLAILTLLAHNTRLAFNVFFGMLTILPGLISVVVLVNSRVRLVYFLWLKCFIILFLSVYGLLHNGRGPGGIVRDENDLALTLVTFLPFLFFLVSISSRIISKVFVIFVILLSIIALTTTFSRGGFVGFILILVVFLVLNKNKFKFTFFILIVALFIWFQIDESYLYEVSTITETTEGTAQSRIQAWKSAWDMFIDNPLGVGGGNFVVHFPEYQTEWFGRNMWGRQAHSIWFTLLPETGFIGTLIFLSILKCNFKLLNKIKIKASSSNDCFKLYCSLLASFVGFFAAATFLSVLYYPHFWVLTSILIASTNVMDSELSCHSQRSV